MYGPLVVDPCFKMVETFEFAASIEESVTLGSGSGRFVGCLEGFLEL